MTKITDEKVSVVASRWWNAAKKKLFTGSQFRAELETRNMARRAGREVERRRNRVIYDLPHNYTKEDLDKMVQFHHGEDGPIGSAGGSGSNGRTFRQIAMEEEHNLRLHKLRTEAHRNKNSKIYYNHDVF